MPRPKGPQWVRVYTTVPKGVVPHEGSHEASSESDNTHPWIFHAGTEKAAKSFGGVTHAYDIDKSALSGVVYGDEGGILAHMDEDNKQDEHYVAGVKKSGVQEGLFESIPAETQWGKPVPSDDQVFGDFEFMHGTNVLQYRNLMEDPGSISFMIPKRAVGKTVIHRGVV